MPQVRLEHKREKESLRCSSLTQPLPPCILLMKTLITEFKRVTKVNQGKIQDQEVSQQPILYSIIFKEIEK